VLAGETLYCIGRGYGVIPEAIAQVNGLATPFFVQPGQALRIPAVRWVNITLGPVCPPQFTSPFPALPTATLTPRPSATSTNTSAPPPPPAATSTNTPVALTPTSTPVVPTPTFSPTPTATLDTFGPTITNLNVNPTSVGAGSPVFSCLVTFNVDISDPAGILVSPGPMVLWTASDLSGMAFANSTIPMTLLTGITWTASLSVDMTFAPSSPYYGTVNWSVQASDNLNNSTTQPSLTTIDVPLAQGGCP
jgi:LysM repeat protein